MRFFLLYLVFMLSSCTGKMYLNRIESYLNASSVKEKSRFISENYRSYFLSKSNDGDDKATMLNDFINWDGQLHPDVNITSYTRHGNEWLVYFNEQNDFSKLIGYPGWKGSMKITFNDKKNIEESVYIPGSSNLPYKNWLSPAIEWLQKNMPVELGKVYQDNKLVKTQDAAIRWIDLLRQWNKHKAATP